MSKNNNNSIAKQALLDMESIKAAIKEESKNTLKTLMAEAVKDSLREAAKEEDEKEYELQGEEQDADMPVDAGEQQQPEEANAQPEEGETPEQPEAEQPAEDAEEAEEGAEPEDEWGEFADYKVGDDTYDLTGVEDPEQVVKVYKLLKNDDQVVVRKEGTKVSVKDNETDAEYVIDLGGEEEMPEQAEGEEGPVVPEEEAQLNEEWHEDADFEFKHGDEKKLDLADDMENFEEDENDEEESVEDEDEYWDEKFNEKKEDEENFDYPVGTEGKFGIAGLDENKKNSRKTMKEGKKQEVIFEVDLGYTDDYQKEDPIAGLSSEEPSKQGRSVDKGIPTGTKKPWAGEKKPKASQPFEVVAEEEEVEAPEVEAEEGEIEENITTAKSKKRRMVKVMAPNSGDVDKPYVTKVTSVAGKQLAEIKAENKELKEAVLALKKSLNESLVTNVNLGKVTKLFVENTTSQAEKVEIINRFCNEAKTIEQSKALYETISRELKKNVNAPVVNEAVVAAKPVMNEAKAQKSSDLMNTIDLMNRVMKL